jgi:late competence protein required for DNA uptake (superfamily II DNA/RNA helicase)
MAKTRKKNIKLEKDKITRSKTMEDMNIEKEDCLSSSPSFFQLVQGYRKILEQRLLKMIKLNRCQKCQRLYEPYESDIYKSDIYCKKCLNFLFGSGNLKLFVFKKYKGNVENNGK